MSIVESRKAYISQAIYLASNAIDKRVRYKQELAEDCFRSFFDAQSMQTNIPDEADPTQPRLIFQNGQKQLLLTQMAAQLSLGFDSATKSTAEQLSIIIKNIKDIHQRIEKFSGVESLLESALIITTSFPSDKSREELAAFLFDRFVKIKPIANVASSLIKVGYKLDSGMFLNYEFDVYEKRSGEIKASNQTQTFHINDFPVVETGISIKIDINNKPQTVLENYKNLGPDQLIDTVCIYATEVNSLLGLE